jgi:hypothetical protein
LLCGGVSEITAEDNLWSKLVFDTRKEQNFENNNNNTFIEIIEEK